MHSIQGNDGGQLVETLATRPSEAKPFNAVIGVLLLAAVVLAGCTETGPGAEEIAPDFSLTDSEGNAVTLSSLEGRPVLLYFASVVGCPSCAEYTRGSLVPLWQESNASVDFVTVTPGHESDSDLNEFRQRYGAEWPHARDTDTVIQRYGILYTSTVVILDSEHVIVFKDVDPNEGRVKQALGLCEDGSRC